MANHDLPPLPKPALTFTKHGSEGVFTADQMREYALAALTLPPAAGQEPVPILNAVDVLNRMKYTPETTATAADFLLELWASGMCVIASPAALPQGNAPAGGTTQGEQQ